MKNSIDNLCQDKPRRYVLKIVNGRFVTTTKDAAEFSSITGDVTGVRSEDRPDTFGAMHRYWHLEMEDKGEKVRYDVCATEDSRTFMHILGRLASCWGRRGLSDIIIDFRSDGRWNALHVMQGSVELAPFVGTRQPEEVDDPRKMTHYYAAVIRKKCGLDGDVRPAREAVKKSEGPSHADIIPLRNEEGRRMVAGIIKDIDPAYAKEQYYTSLGEFAFGGDEGSGGGRFDSVVLIRTLENVSDYGAGIRVGLEIKCSVDNLLQDGKFKEKYIKSGICDYYYLVATTDEVAKAAVRKYSDCPQIGVIRYATGAVLKTPARSAVTSEGFRQFKEGLFKRQQELKSRRVDCRNELRYRHLGRAKNNNLFSSYFVHDSETILLHVDRAGCGGSVTRLEPKVRGSLR